MISSQFQTAKSKEGAGQLRTGGGLTATTNTHRRVVSKLSALVAPVCSFSRRSTAGQYRASTCSAQSLEWVQLCTQPGL